VNDKWKKNRSCLNAHTFKLLEKDPVFNEYFELYTVYRNKIALNPNAKFWISYPDMTYLVFDFIKLLELDVGTCIWTL